MFKILTIDDDPVLQMILKRILQDQGYEVITAFSGEEGLVQARQVQPAMIICDWLMEGIDGLEVCRQLKSDPDLSACFFILLTSRTAVEDRVIGLDAGADDFLAKPIDISELQARVRAGLRLYQAAQDLHDLAKDLQAQKQRLEAELAEAADYVRSLLPEPIRGLLTVNSRFLPSRQLGGDCFDYYWLDPNHFVLYLLDVSGHGLKAALPSVSLHNMLRSGSLPAMNPYQPDSVLQALNAVFQMGRQNDLYFTIWYGVYDQTTRELTYSSAGHPPAVLLSQQTALPQSLRTPGIPVGMFAEAAFSSDRCQIAPSSTLYLFSDGLFDIRPTLNVTWNLERLIETLTHADHSDQALDRILQKVLTATGISTFEDDCSIVQICFQ